MSDIRFKSKKIKLPPVDFYFEVKKDLYGSFDVMLKWQFDTASFFENLKEFRVYKSVFNTPRLIKSYDLSQEAVEKITSAKVLNLNSNVLYDKSLISQNSQVSVVNSNSEQHKKQESFNKYSFYNIATIKAVKNEKNYRFLDKNVKFGETYSYYITAVGLNNEESAPKQIMVSVEWPINPSPPNYLDLSEVVDGIMIKTGSKDIFISKFIILRREDSEKKFIKIAEISNKFNSVYFIDKTCQPKRNYIYRVYAIDIFKNISLSAAEKSIIYKSFPSNTNIEFRPNFKIINENNSFFKIELENNRPDQISSVKIERRDEWMFSKKFEIKKYNDIYWPTNILFDENNKISFEDRSVSINRAYSYRITSYNFKGQPVSYFITPPVKIGDKFFDKNNQLPKIDSPKIQSLNIEVVSSNQNPVSVKFEWRISGDWSFLNIKTNEKIIKIDNVHREVVLNEFDFGRRYNLLIELYDINSNKVYEANNIIIKT